MINIDNIVKSRHVTFICRIINNEMDSSNAIIGKHWLQKYDNKFGVVFFFFLDAPILKFLISHPFQNTIEMQYKHGAFFFYRV